MDKKTYTVKLHIEKDRSDSCYVQVEGPGGKFWLSFRMSKPTMHMCQKVVDVGDPLSKRIQKILKGEPNGK